VTPSRVQPSSAAPGAFVYIINAYSSGMAPATRTRHQRAAKEDSTLKSVAFFNELSWTGDKDADESTKDRERQHADSPSPNRNLLDSLRPGNYFEAPESPDTETRQPSRHNLDSPSKQLAMEEESIRDGSPVDGSEGEEEEEDEEEENEEEEDEEEENEEEENDDIALKKEPDDENEDDGEADDGNEENEADQGSSSDSDSSISESAENHYRGTLAPVVAMPVLKYLENDLLSESGEADDRPQGTDNSDEKDGSKSDDNEHLLEESQRSEENGPQSGSEYNDSESEQSDSEQEERFETPPQQLRNNRPDSENQKDTLRRSSQITTVTSPKNLKRKERLSLNERASKSPRVDGRTSHSASAHPSNSPGHGYVEWEYDMEAENQPQRDTTVDADDHLFEEATQVMGLERSWKRLVSGCHELRTRESHIRPVFHGIESLRGHIFNMQELYKQMQEDQRTGSITVDLKDDLQKHAEFVRDKSIAILTKLVRRANTAKETDNWDMKNEASTLAELIVLDVVPELGDLAKECLKAYYAESTLTEGGFVAVLEILEMMRLLDGKIFSLKSCYRINILDYGRGIRSALSNLWKWLDQGEFYARQQKCRQPAPKQRPWTEDEEAAVIEGLKLYEGEEQRFQYLAEDYAAELGGRNENEIRKKARELYNDYLQAKNVSLTWLLED
jgi:hypothetical protein